MKPLLSVEEPYKGDTVLKNPNLYLQENRSNHRAKENTVGSAELKTNFQVHQTSNKVVMLK